MCAAKRGNMLAGVHSMLKDFLINHQNEIEKESRRLFLQLSVPMPTVRELG
jgi:hypothetical protein